MELGRVPVSKFWARLRCWRLLQSVRFSGRVELIELLKREMEVRFWRRQRREGKGPAMLVEERSMEVTE